MNRRRAARFAAVAGMVALAGIGYKAVRLGISDAYATYAQLEIDSWAAPKRKARGDEWSVAYGGMQQSLDWLPASAWALESMGTLRLRQVRSASDPQIATIAARSAYTELRRTLVERPTSAFAWSNLALAKLYLGEVDDELFEALGRAVVTGPWEPEPMQTVAFVGLAVWPRATPAHQTIIVGALERFARREPERAVQLARGFSRGELLCEAPASEMLAAACKPRK